MLNPSTDKFTIEFGPAFYNKNLTQKYNDFLFNKNSPLKNIQDHLHESIQSIVIPGMSLNTIAVNGLNNFGAGQNPRNGNSPGTVNQTYPGNAPLNEVYDSTTVTVSFRNTLLNYMFIYEVFRAKYNRQNSLNLKDFDISIVLRDSAEIPMLSFSFMECFTSVLPGLEFSYNTSFRESKNFDVSFVFQKMDVRFLIPEFNIQK